MNKRHLLSFLLLILISMQIQAILAAHNNKDGIKWSCKICAKTEPGILIAFDEYKDAIK